MIELTKLLKKHEKFDVVSIEGSGHDYARKISKLIGDKIENFIEIKPSSFVVDISEKKIKWKKGYFNTGNSCIVCDDHFRTGGTIKFILNYLIKQGYKEKNLYASFSSLATHRTESCGKFLSPVQIIDGKRI